MVALGQEQPRRKNEGIKPSRRDVVAGLASVIGSAILPVSGAEAKESREALRADELYFQKLIKDPAEQEKFRKAPTPEMLGAVMRSLAKANATWIEPFKRDKKLMHKGALALRDHFGTFFGNGTIIKVPIGKEEEHPASYRYLVVTAAHIADIVTSPPGKPWTRHSAGRDVAIRGLSDQELAAMEKDPTNALPLMPRESGKDTMAGVVGMVAANANIAGALGRKLFRSRLSPTISHQVMKGMGLEIPQGQYKKEEDINALHMIALPPGDALKVYDGNRPVGNSGAAFGCMHPNSGELALGGFFVAKGITRVQERTYNTGYVMDIAPIHEVIDELVQGLAHRQVSLAR